MSISNFGVISCQQHNIFCVSPFLALRENTQRKYFPHKHVNVSAPAQHRNSVVIVIVWLFAVHVSEHISHSVPARIGYFLYGESGQSDTRE